MDASPRLTWWQQAWRLTAAAAIGLLAWLSSGVLMSKGPGDGPGTWFLVGDPLVALGCLTALLWRRRFPLAVALIVAIASGWSAFAGGTVLVAFASIATRRRPVEIAAVVLAYVAASQVAVGFYPVQETSGLLWFQLLVPALIAGIAVAVGMAVGARRVEVRSLRDRAESAEREQTARAAQARALERNRIAHEMHDVLAHRISLVAMQAGVLDHRSDLRAEESRLLVRGIAEGSHQALEELRDVLGILRADQHRTEPPEAQASLERVPDLVADARASGLDVTLTDTVTGTPPDVVGRTCYRVVQEGLTNAAKHAPGAQVHITLGGESGRTLDVRVHSSSAAAPAVRPPSSGFGLLGLTERVDLAGGQLDHHRTPDGGYLLTAQLPWPNPGHERRT
ncbi:Sensor histidine kinase DesK [Streptomyces sp. YIM 130001]|nr:Sensor histidine kinase DesK [Streptomyces sp. YIM 130001]